MDVEELKYLGDKARETIEIQFSEEEMEAKRRQTIDNFLSIASLETDKKEKVAEFDKQIKPLKVENAKLLEQLRTGFTTETKEVFTIPDFSAGVMELYCAESGKLLGTRTLFARERQLQFRG